MLITEEVRLENAIPRISIKSFYNMEPGGMCSNSARDGSGAMDERSLLLLAVGSWKSRNLIILVGCITVRSEMRQ